MQLISTLSVLVLALGSGKGFPVESDPGGCRLERLVAVAGENHVLFRGISPDGRYLAVGWDRKARSGATERGAYLLDLESGARRDLPGLNNAASFSPDGKRLVAANYPPADHRELKTEIVEYDIASHALRSLAPDSAMEWLPSYSPDGRWVVFNSMRTGASDLYRVNLETLELQRLTDDPRYEAHAQFSGDGRRVLFHRQIEADDYALAILEIPTLRVTELPGSAREESYPAWSPDGKWIAYSSDALSEKGKPDLYVMRADGSVTRRLTTHPDKDAYATFSPDGESIVYMNQRDNGVRIYRMQLENGDCLRVHHELK